MRTASLVLLTALIAAAVAADPVTLSGTVVDDAGNPLAAVPVRAITFATDTSSMRPTALASTRTDAEGRFTIEGVEHDPENAARRINVVAMPEGRAVGWTTLQEDPADLRIVCGEPVSLGGRVSGADGRGTAAEVRAYVIYKERTTDRLTYALYVPEELREELALTCDANGVFTAGWCSAGMRAGIMISADGMGTVSTILTADGPATVTLQPAATLRGRLVCAEQPDAAAGVTISVRGYDREANISWSDEVETDAEGRFEVTDLHPGETTVAPQWSADAVWQAPARTVTPEPGEAVEVELPMQQTYLLTGRVVDEESGEAIEGARVYISSTPAGRSSIAPTDAEGRWSLRVLPGRTVVYPGAPEGYVNQEFGQRNVEVTVTDADATAPDIALKRGVTVTGRVVDAQGQPVPEADVVHTAQQFSFHSPTKTDADGAFTITGVDPDSTFTVQARKGDLMTGAPLTVDGGVGEPIELVVRENAGVRLAVRVVDGEGNPVAGAQVMGYWRAENWGTYPTLGETDADGRLVSELQWPQGTYKVTVTAPGCDQAESEEWAAVSGETHDFGELTLVRAEGVVAGTVVDADGQPVAGATVINRGDGPSEVRIQADEQGRFRVEGLYPGMVCLIAESGELFGGARVASGSEDVTITIAAEPGEVTLGEPVVVAPLTDREACREVALSLIEEVLSWPEERTGRYHASFVGELAKLDPDRAFELSAEADGAYDQTIFRELGGSLLHESPDEALAYLEMIDNTQRRLYEMLRAIHALSATDPERARQELLALIPQASMMPEPKYEAQFLGSCADALYALDPEAAVPVARRAEQIAQTLQLTDWDAYARGTVAEALCHFDLDAALALIADLTGDYEPTRHQPNIAARIAAEQPDRAAELMGVIDDFQRARKMARVVYHMAPAHPDEAVELANSITGTYSFERVRCLGYIALALRESDPARSAEMFAQAVEAAARLPASERGGWDAEQTTATMAELAYIGAQIGYPDLDRLIWRTIALRPAPTQEPWGAGQQEGAYLRPLAFVAPELTCDLIRDLAARHPMAEAELHSDRTRNVLYAASAADAHLAAELALDLPADEPGGEVPWFTMEVLLTVRNLLREPDQRFIEMMSEYGGWVPGALSAD